MRHSGPLDIHHFCNTIISMYTQNLIFHNVNRTLHVTMTLTYIHDISLFYCDAISYRLYYSQQMFMQMIMLFGILFYLWIFATPFLWHRSLIFEGLAALMLHVQGSFWAQLMKNDSAFYLCASDCMPNCYSTEIENILDIWERNHFHNVKSYFPCYNDIDVYPARTYNHQKDITWALEQIIHRSLGCLFKGLTRITRMKPPKLCSPPMSGFYMFPCTNGQ